MNIPQPLNFKVFIFNVTNPNEVIEGGTPMVKEIGPYVYKYVNDNFKCSHRLLK